MRSTLSTWSMLRALCCPAVLVLWAGTAASVSAQAQAPDTCSGDEQLSFAPTTPEVGAELIVAVTSATRHRAVLLTSSERPNPLREYEGRLGWVWVWSVTPVFSGPHKFQFYVDTTIFCVEQTIVVAPSSLPGLAGGVSAAAPAPPARTPGSTGPIRGRPTSLAAGSPRSARAAKAITIEACVVERRPTSALMTPGARVLFEVDLRGVANTEFALKQDECVTIVGLDRGNAPGLRREFPTGSWLVEAQVIQAPRDRSPRT